MTNQTREVAQKRRYERQVTAARYWLLSQADKDPAYFAAVDALEFARAHHNGKRNGGGPEFMHQVEIFHMLRSLRHYLNNPVMSYILAFMHDAIEDGQKQPDGSKVYIPLSVVASRWGDEVAEKLMKLSKEIEGVKNSAYSLDAVFNDEDCALVKLADRCNNVSTMMGVFKRERALRYIKETTEEFIPRAKSARRRFPQQEGAFENLKLFLSGQMALIELMMPTYQIEEPVKVEAQTPVEKNIDLKMILATGDDGVIGTKSGDLIFRCSEDMQHFRDRTTGHALIMGRKTFDSIAKKNDGTYKQNPLKDRFIYVLSNRPEAQAGEGYEFVEVDKTRSMAAITEGIYDRVQKSIYKDKPIWICGGASVYWLFVDSKYLTEVDHTVMRSADTLHGDVCAVVSNMLVTDIVKVGFAATPHNLVECLNALTPYKWEIKLESQGVCSARAFYDYDKELQIQRTVNKIVRK